MVADRRIIRGATVLALDGRRTLRRTDVLIEDGVIAAIGGVDSPGALISEVQGILLPGLVQAHVHLEQTWLDRGFVADVDPAAYHQHQLPAWRAALDPRVEAIQAGAAFASGLTTGTTTFADAGGGAAGGATDSTVARRFAAIEAARALGVRLVAGLDATGEGDVARDLDVLGSQLAERSGADGDAHPEPPGAIGLSVWGGDAERTPISRLARGARAAAAKGVPFAVHLGALPGDRSGVRRLERAGALGKNLVVCQGAGPSLRDPRVIEALAAAGASVVLTPAFDLLMRAESPPIEALFAARVNLGLGSESGATRLGLDLLREARLLYRWLGGRVPDPASNALEIATRGGAAALGVAAGSIKVGQHADLMLLDVEGGPSDDHELVARRIIVQAEPAAIRTLWVGGQVVASDGRATRGGPTPEQEAAARARVDGAWAGPSRAGAVGRYLRERLRRRVLLGSRGPVSTARG